MKDDFVMESSSIKRMGMADQGGVSSIAGTLVKQGFEAAGGAVEKE